MKKLLFLVNVDWFFISHRLPIARAAVSAGYEVHVACGLTDRREFLESEGLIVHPLPLSRSGTAILSEIRTLLAIFNVIRKLRPDVLHTVTIKPVLYGNLAARAVRISRRVASISGLGYTFTTESRSGLLLKMVSALYRWALRGVDAVIFQNRSDYESLESFGAVTERQAVFIRGSGVDLTQYVVAAEPEGPPVVMLISRLLIEKGVGEFVDAARLLKRTSPDVRMVLVGDIDPANRGSLDELQINAFCREGAIEYWGSSDNVVETMAQANLVVLPSYREGLPKVLIEAAACGRAVVTTDVPGCRDAVEPNRSALLVPVRDSQALAIAIQQLIDDPRLRSQFALRARHLAEEAFDIQDVVHKHLALYRG